VIDDSGGGPAGVGLQVGVLEHRLVRLEPLSLEHIPGFERAAAGENDTIGFASVPTSETAAAYVRASLDRAAGGDSFPFAQVLPDGRVVGHTSFLGLRFWPDGKTLLAVEVGASWLAASARGTAVNTATKLLLFTHAFESWGASRVDVKTDERNERARAGIVAVGARFEGILRNWQPSAAPGEEGLPRNTAMHAVTSDQWPATKRMLEERIEIKDAGGPPVVAEL
jgi:RimJ/RimL family protein N-acetyltransferase